MTALGAMTLSFEAPDAERQLLADLARTEEVTVVGLAGVPSVSIQCVVVLGTVYARFPERSQPVLGAARVVALGLFMDVELQAIDRALAERIDDAFRAKAPSEAGTIVVPFGRRAPIVRIVPREPRS